MFSADNYYFRGAGVIDSWVWDRLLFREIFGEESMTPEQQRIWNAAMADVEKAKPEFIRQCVDRGTPRRECEEGFQATKRWLEGARDFILGEGVWKW